MAASDESAATDGLRMAVARADVWPPAAAKPVAMRTRQKAPAPDLAGLTKRLALLAGSLAGLGWPRPVTPEQEARCGVP